MSIKSYFKVLTEDDIEQHELKAKQVVRKVQRLTEQVASKVIDLVETNINSPIIIIDDAADKDTETIGDVVRRAFDDVTEDFVPVTTTSQSVTLKRHKNIQRPTNWREIVQHYGIYKKCAKTMRKFNLELLNPSYEYWVATLAKWKKHASNPMYVSHRGRESAIGRKVECELVAVVERYNSHGVPMTNYILRCNLMTLLLKHNKEVVLKRVDDGDLVFGKAWCTRFYQRNKLSLRAATTKMRDEIPADYEAKKELFVLHLSKAIHDHNVPDDLIGGGDETNSQQTLQDWRSFSFCRYYR